MLCHSQQHLMEVDSVSKSYGGRRILSGIYLKVKTGDVCALFGRNGTGKSTLQRIIFGSLSAGYKFVCIDDQMLKTPYTHSSSISYLPDDFFIPSDLKVKKALELYNLSIDDVDEFIKSLSDKRIYSLSSGERRYLEIYLILRKEAHFVLLDEPFKFLSPLMITRMEQLILSESEKKGIIVADHRYKSVLKIANRILLVKDEALYELSDEKELADKGYILL
ncbi:ABC-type multidrug transport system ATPase subunit [Dysgonomonas sp. PFB1-18]|uniref:ATP-binding cassette domain-containing protein n=1 Tax=unclassified Dysgonomonas TaxID=2630389 RepID=UPI002476593E|nr:MULTISPECIES: ATP-binding cassette domain-containing protein [unclassified Dysgonomonas]MDH6308649.1 ABC-type multidrug transport system ATPase subunit [Dysgonomonas sp. PF1-14]MDH6338150.1 ABC-type multidrug transport system ATPase subunit [Dysgonomonas sp. PF1-16]MDH6379647.1 ABC-type multidrug transport system ATPase subunit [Dysgonomonas sp. PFB1-18]MDH6396977.1 ABC-type multidrug transport system ATPase subunit [Dysgonomonas sp. PF1-23]